MAETKKQDKSAGGKSGHKPAGTKAKQRKKAGTESAPPGTDGNGAGSGEAAARRGTEPKSRKRAPGEVVADLRQKMQAKIEELIAQGEPLKGALADYLKLLELERDLKDDAVREIEVRWIDPPTLSDDTK